MILTELASIVTLVFTYTAAVFDFADGVVLLSDTGLTLLDWFCIVAFFGMVIDFAHWFMTGRFRKESSS